jgi:tetratricopeptide (TPR) repeat protein
MPEPILLLLAVLLAGVVVLAPLWRRPPVVVRDDARDGAKVRHRVALETLRDVEADRRAGSLDGAAYAEQLAEAEARAAVTAAALDAAPDAPPGTRRAGGTAAIATAAILGAALVGGSLLPNAGVANTTVVNEALAAAQAAEAAREERIETLLVELVERPDNPAAFSELADAYLADPTGEDLPLAVEVLKVLIQFEPERANAYERVIGAYVRGGDYVNARRALDAYERIATADPVEVAVFDGCIALRGENDVEAAAGAFDRFLELAPDDPRAEMIRGLRAGLGD